MDENKLAVNDQIKFSLLHEQKYKCYSTHSILELFWFFVGVQHLCTVAINIYSIQRGYGAHAWAPSLLFCCFAHLAMLSVECCSRVFATVLSCYNVVWKHLEKLCTNFMSESESEYKPSCDETNDSDAEVEIKVSPWEKRGKIQQITKKAIPTKKLKTKHTEANILAKW